MEPNQHWTNLFKVKPSTSQNEGNEESNRPEPKPRWKPTAEQIRILESKFSSGMVKPSSDEISGIRAQLQEFGQVGDNNVFYWFQNRRSRAKKSQRHLQPSANDIKEGTGENSIEGQSIVVSVNNKTVQVSVGPINVRAVFGENAVLLHFTGQPVLVNELGFTLEGLQHGAGYYVVSRMPMHILIPPQYETHGFTKLSQ